MTFSLAIQADAGTEMRGTVYILGEKDECVPAKNTSVRIEETKGSDVTTDDGGFRISLPDVFKPGDPVTLFVDKPGYQIWDPLEGEIPIPTDPLKNPIIIKLDKLGSHRFFSKMQFEWFIRKISDDAKAQVKEKDPNDQIDFTRYLKDWAVKYGFGINEVRAELDKWADEIEANEMDYHKLGLAAFYRKQFGKAAEEFTRSGEQHNQKLIKVREKKQEIQKQEKELVEKFIRDYRLAGDSYYYNYHFHDALASYEKALKEADRKVDPIQWASLMNDISKTYWNLGIRSEGQIQHKYFIESVKGYHEILLIYTRETLPQQWAMTQNNLGAALSDQGIR
jgi:tetratricopeptide (TPR) repeat protein